MGSFFLIITVIHYTMDDKLLLESPSPRMSDINSIETLESVSDKRLLISSVPFIQNDNNNCLQNPSNCSLPPLTPECLFPEKIRSHPLSRTMPSGEACSIDSQCSSNQICLQGACIADRDRYNFETCSFVDENSTNDLVRVYYNELGDFKTLFPTTTRFGDCNLEDCFLRVNTAHMGKTLTLSGNEEGTYVGLNGVSCEDPSLLSLGHCGWSIDSTEPIGSANDIKGYRGNAIIADTIYISGVIYLDELSLVLIATTKIEFLPNSKIIGTSHLEKPEKPKDPIVSSFYRDSHNHEVLEPLTQEQISDLQIPFQMPSGLDGNSSKIDGNTVVLASPSVIGSGIVDLRGAPGADGGNGYKVDCNYSHLDEGDTDSVTLNDLFSSGICTAVIKKNVEGGEEVNGGRGGDGGKGGHFYIFTGLHCIFYCLELQVDVHGGLGGEGGQAGTLEYLGSALGGYTPKIESIGSDGLTGTKGQTGLNEQRFVSNDGLLDLAFLFASRGAERHMINARHYARYSYPPENNNANLSAQHLLAFLNSYCRYQVLIFYPVFEENELNEPNVRQQMCLEAETHLSNLERGLNFFGLDPTMYMYVPPITVATIKNDLIDIYNSPSSPAELFWNSVDNSNTQDVTSAILEDRYIQEKNILNESIGLLALANNRRAHLEEEVLVAIKRFEREQETIEAYQERLANLGNEAEMLLQKPDTPDCGLLCIARKVIDFSVTIASLVQNSLDAINVITSFVEGLDELFSSFDEIYEGKLIDNLLDLDAEAGKIELLAETTRDWAKQFWEGTDDISGLGDSIKAGRKIPSLVTKWTELGRDAEALGELLGIASANVADSTLRAGASNIQLSEELLDAQGYLIESIERASEASGLVDREGGIAKLREMLAIINLQLESSYRSDTLLEEHALALGELNLIQSEITLLEIDILEKEKILERTECRLGRLSSSQCDDIVPLVDDLLIRQESINSFCRSANYFNDSLLLFDFLYHRSQDFVLLEQSEANILDNSHNFQRNLLVSTDRLTFNEDEIEDVIHEFVDSMNNQQAGQESRQYCLGDQTVCEPESLAIMTQLQISGQTYFDIGIELSSDAQRKRVTNADVALLFLPGYRLGCESLENCPMPSLSSLPLDQPMGQQSIRLEISHDEIATFRMSASDWETFAFSKMYPMSVCEATNVHLQISRDCSQLANFSDTVFYDVPSVYLLNRPGIDEYSVDGLDVNPLFGTSVSGRWHLDARPIIRNLNGGLYPNDGCYNFAEDPTESLPGMCYPAVYEGWNEEDIPPYWQPDANGVTEVERVCSQYIINGALESYGVRGTNNSPISCCTQDGNLAPDRDKLMCDSVGFSTEATCTTPDICWEICGPRCKTFKEAIIGIDFNVFWREGIQR